MSPEPRSTTNSGQARKTATKSFSGCWTCRAKHVKCDETKPSCERCQKAGISCEGYGVRLSWTSVRNPSTFRSRTPSRRKAAQRASDKLLHTRDLDSVEGSDNDQEPVTGDIEMTEETGESSGQPLQSEIATPPGPTPQSLFEEPPLDGGLNSRIFHSYELLGQGLATRLPSIPVSHEQPLFHQPQLPHQSFAARGDGSLSSIHRRHSTNTPNRLSDIGTSSLGITGGSLNTSLSPSSDQARSRARHQVNQQAEHVSKPTRHLDILPNPSLQCELLEHWTLHLCDALNPSPGIYSPLRTVMMPIALEGCRTESKKATGATALFHLICSASAFHLAQKRTTPDSRRDLENVALEHHNLGITHLAQNIRSDDRSQCVSVLASLVMCILNEAITLPTQFWRLHFRGAVEWVNHIEPQVWHQTEAAATIYQMFLGMATLIQAQLLLDGHETCMWDFKYDPGSQPEPYTLGMAFGLPQPLLQGIHAMNAFEMRRKYPESRTPDQSEPPSRQTLDRLELELYLSVPKKPDASVCKDYGDLIYHHGCTFYFAALIHMKRGLKVTPIADVQPLVEQAVHHLEALQTCTNRPFCPMLWPVAVAAFEASEVTLQHRMLKCLDFFLQRSDLAIWAQLTNVVSDLWNARRAQGVELKWHETSLGSMSDCLMLL
ncbi:hypothetical protein FZEAL_5016 [Fusarium zealandicum]|uniref:Zn(2)-C6 fungal-type domain-containing protein n=1 Tax=Fusarium zealandicum TaxID=1053134 RepID=A0A8H4UL23_9HYPO|nr:hypothetical protein FZEAL_5016 [Fusarium zealandicum]